jgi:hypothetical protein
MGGTHSGQYYGYDCPVVVMSHGEIN